MGKKQNIDKEREIEVKDIIETEIEWRINKR